MSAAEPVMCHLCQQFGDYAEADLYATVPMCGRYPRYPLCLPCYEDIASECEDVRLIEDVSHIGSNGEVA